MVSPPLTFFTAPLTPRLAAKDGSVTAAAMDAYCFAVFGTRTHLPAYCAAFASGTPMNICSANGSPRKYAVSFTRRTDTCPVTPLCVKVTSCFPVVFATSPTITTFVTPDTVVVA